RLARRPPDLHQRPRGRHELQAERSKHAPGRSALHRLARYGRKCHTCFPVEAMGNQTSDVPIRIVDNSSLNGYFAGFYLQDEWKPFEQLAINFGGRIDIAKTIETESQFSPRINIVYTPWAATTFHAGYARYFTPPPLEN